MPLHDGHWTRPEAFVGDGETISHPDEKRGDDLQ